MSSMLVIKSGPILPGLPERFCEWHAQGMMRDKFGVMLGLVLACAVPAITQELGPWRAANSTAESITGDVAFGETKIAINFSSFPLARIRALEPAEVSSVFDVDSSSGARGTLYRLDIPAAKKFLHKNSLCGSEDTQWIAAFVAGRTLHLAFFSGQKMPVFTPDAIANSTDMCGTFLYAR
jgi:hypothetical protein